MSHANQMYRVALVGATGYAGMELLRLVTGHPNMELTVATSRTDDGTRLDALYPFLLGTPTGEVELVKPDPELIAKEADICFLAVPHGAAMDTAAELLGAGLRVVDLSADFRLKDPEVYAEWYGLAHRQTDLIAEAVYGLPELNGEAIANARLIAGPGCYPTAAILGLWPAAIHRLIDPDDIVIDAKSGTSGAGRKASVGTLYCEVADNFRAYNIGKHRHTPEIEQIVGELAGLCATTSGPGAGSCDDFTVSFTPHLLPINRGILATIYTHLADGVDAASVRETYEAHYANHPYVRVLPEGVLPETRWVRGTMYADIGLVADPRTGRLIIVSAIDNVNRGAAGQAVACANLMLGLDVDAGLTAGPLMP